MTLEANHYGTVCYNLFDSSSFTLRAFRIDPALCYSAFAVNDYGFRLKCLAPVPIRFVKYPGQKHSMLAQKTMLSLFLLHIWLV